MPANPHDFVRTGMTGCPINQKETGAELHFRKEIQVTTVTVGSCTSIIWATLSIPILMWAGARAGSEFGNTLLMPGWFETFGMFNRYLEIFADSSHFYRNSSSARVGPGMLRFLNRDYIKYWMIRYENLNTTEWRESPERNRTVMDHIAGNPDDLKLAKMIYDTWQHWGLNPEWQEYHMEVPDETTNQIDMVWFKTGTSRRPFLKIAVKEFYWSAPRRMIQLGSDEHPIRMGENICWVSILELLLPGTATNMKGQRTSKCVIWFVAYLLDQRTPNDLVLELVRSAVQFSSETARVYVLYPDLLHSDMKRHVTASDDVDQFFSAYHGLGHPATPGWSSNMKGDPLRHAGTKAPFDSYAEMIKSPTRFFYTGYRQIQLFRRRLGYATSIWDDGEWRERGDMPRDCPEVDWETIRCATYSLYKQAGSASTPFKVKLQASEARPNKRYKKKRIVNVIGTVPGHSEEADWVIVGASRDGQGPAARTAGQGFAVLMALSSAVGYGIHSYPFFQSKRTIKFASWGGSAIGALGSTEFVERNSWWLKRHLKLYIDVNQPYQGGNLTKAYGSPIVGVLPREYIRANPFNRTRRFITVESHTGRGDHTAFSDLLGAPTITLRANEVPPTEPVPPPTFSVLRHMLTRDNTKQDTFYKFELQYNRLKRLWQFMEEVTHEYWFLISDCMRNPWMPYNATGMTQVFMDLLDDFRWTKKLSTGREPESMTTAPFLGEGSFWTEDGVSYPKAIIGFQQNKLGERVLRAVADNNVDQFLRQLKVWEAAQFSDCHASYQIQGSFSPKYKRMWNEKIRKSFQSFLIDPESYMHHVRNPVATALSKSRYTSAVRNGISFCNELVRPLEYSCLYGKRTLQRRINETSVTDTLSDCTYLDRFIPVDGNFITRFVSENAGQMIGGMTRMGHVISNWTSLFVLPVHLIDPVAEEVSRQRDQYLKGLNTTSTTTATTTEENLYLDYI